MFKSCIKNFKMVLVIPTVQNTLMQYVWSFFKNKIITLVISKYTFFGLPYLSSTLILLYLVGSTKNEARDKATQETLDMLSKKCYTILVKNKYLSAQGETIDANELSDPLNPNNDSKPTGYAIEWCTFNTYEFL